MSKRGRIAETYTLLTTGLLKLVGLVSATNQLLITQHPSSLALVISGLFVAGVQATEGIVLVILDRAFAPAKPPPTPPEEKEHV